MGTFVFDLDGTICFDRYSVAPPIKRSMEAIAEQHSIVIASARHPANIITTITNPWFSLWDVVGANGAICYTKGQRANERRLPADQARLSLQALAALECPYLAYGADFVIFSQAAHPLHAAISADIGTTLRRGSDNELGTLAKILVLPQSGDARALAACQAIPGLQVYAHTDGSFDIVTAGVDKASALTVLGHTLPTFASFGNDLNDLTLLHHAQHAVCVGDSSLLASVADYQIPTGPGQIEAIAELILRIAAYGHLSPANANR
ncbi:HAD hydrolase family protein [Rhizobium rhizogenes]|jgi:hydroxymethylpyrimidine pyrophosphatase-like HAD family hydrolase|uniref:HAD hydrolase family protein n=1 Tax=Rhizobium rhizogenes TaxID=359 RepID=UPI001574CC64|nr:HAD hydrolase family protein [Rhizobium rhizogenes]NTF85391.1 HAD hydrolase family protein [Rhizobium rhizogenes]NTI31332.1 HAD hydrolase family protein [Rhizobium rhizogenes]